MLHRDNEQLKKDELFFDIIKQGDLNEIKQKVENKSADPNAKNIANCTAIMYAGNLGRVDIMAYLLEKGAKVETKLSDGRLAIWVPVQDGYIDVLNFYIKNGVDLNAIDDHLHNTALHGVIDCPLDTQKQIEMLNLLKNNNGIQHINLLDHDGRTPLMLACLRNNVEIAEWLLEQGADVTVKNNHDENVFDLIKKSHHQDMLEVIVNDSKRKLSNKNTQSNPLLNQLLNANQAICINEDAIKQLPGMNKDKQTYFLEKRNELSILVDKGMSLPQLAQVNFEQLKKVVERIYRLDNILNVVTLQQIFNLNHQPKALPKDFRIRVNTFGSSSGIGSGGSPEKFFFKQTGPEINVTYQQKSSNRMLWITLDKYSDYCDKLAALQSKQKRYLHRWVELDPNDSLLQQIIFINQKRYHHFDESGVEEESLNNKIQKIHYSPDTKQFVYEIYDKEFPISELVKKHSSGVIDNPMYAEIFYGELLADNGSSYEKLRAMKGMTETKLAIIINSLSAAFDAAAELSFKTLLQLDDRRLGFLLENYDKDVEYALELVDLKEIAGLNAQKKSKPLISLFHQGHEKSTPESKKTSSSVGFFTNIRHYFEMEADKKTDISLRK